MRFLKGTILLLSLFLFSTCSKTPNASFVFGQTPSASANRGFYFTGETIQLENTSRDAEHYKWELPDGSISHEKNPRYTISYSREIAEKITLTVHTKNNKKSATVSKAYTLFISPQPTDFFAIDTMTRKPYKKFISNLPGPLYSFRFGEEKLGINGWPLLEGRVLFKSTFPGPGEYRVENDEVSVEVTRTGYLGTMPFKSKQEWGGIVRVTLIENNRLRLTYDQLRVLDANTNKEILVSADLVY